MSDNFWNKRKRKKILKNIINKHGNQYIDILNKYDYNVILQLKDEDFNLNQELLGYLLFTLKLVGFRLENLNFSSEKVRKIVGICYSPEEYIRIDKLCAKYGFDTIIEFIVDNNIKNTIDINSEDITKYQDSKTNTQITIELQERDAKKENLLRNIRNLINPIYVGIINAHVTSNFQNYESFFSSINFETLTEKEKSQISDYLYLRILHKIDINLNSFNDLTNFQQLKQNALDFKFVYNGGDYSLNIFLMILPYVKARSLHSEYSSFRNLNEILSINFDKLKNDFNLTAEGIALIEIIGLCQSIDKLSPDEKEKKILELYNQLKINNHNFDNLDIGLLKKQIRILYACTISESLTPMLSNSSTSYDVKFLGKNSEGVPIYEKTEGKFKFLVHSISSDGGPNQDIKTGSKNFFDNPELWDTLPAEMGTTSLSTSLISNEGLSMAYQNCTKVIYAFDNFDPTSIITISNSDAKTSHALGFNNSVGIGGNEIFDTPDNLVEYPLLVNGAFYTYNEVSFNRYNSGGRKKPNFILCFDGIDDISIKHAKYQNIPILVLKTKKYIEEYKFRINNIKQLIEECDKRNLLDYLKMLNELLLNLKRLLRVYELKFVDTEIELLKAEIEQLNYETLIVKEQIKSGSTIEKIQATLK